VLGLTFKEDCPDLRNSKVVDIIRELNGYGLEVYVHDPVADPGEAKHEYGLELTPWDRLPKADAIVGAVAHKLLIQRPVSDFSAKLKKAGVFVDVNSRYDRRALQKAGFSFWRL
jgi:UDP-N-acetyl-D-galactosamine dehydrogenase